MRVNVRAPCVLVFDRPAERGAPPVASQAPPCALAFEAWHEDDHDVLWWHFPIQEPPYVGSPLSSDWPFGMSDLRALGWTRFVCPSQAPLQEK